MNIANNENQIFWVNYTIRMADFEKREIKK